MRNWPAGMISLLTSDPTELQWADLYTVTLSTLNRPTVFDQFNQGVVSSFFTDTNGSFTIPAGKQAIGNGGSGFSSMYYNRVSFLNDQSSQVMLWSLPTSTAVIGPAVRMSPSVTTMYAAYISATTIVLNKLVSGTATALDTITHTCGLRDIIKIKAQGTLIQVILNGNVILFATDSAITTGAPGIIANGATAGTVTNWVGASIGATYRWTTWAAPVTLNGETWNTTGSSPNGVPLIQRSQLNFTKGTEVGKMDLSLSDNGSLLIGGVPLLQAIAQKQFDNATIALSLVCASPGGSWQGPGVYFYGKVSDVSPGRTLCKITVKDKREEMNQTLPRALFQQSCRWTVFDRGCTLNADSFAVAGTVAAGSNKSSINSNLTQGGPIAAPASACTLSHVSGHAVPAQTYFVRATYITAQGETAGGPESNITTSVNELMRAASPPSATGALFWNCYVSTISGDEQLQNSSPIAIGTSFTMPDYQQSPADGLPVPVINQTGYFDLGYVVWLTGANAGTITAIRTYLGSGVLNFFKPLAQPPATGDTFTIYPGCDKTFATCSYKFSNSINYGGCDLVPPPETTV